MYNPRYNQGPRYEGGGGSGSGGEGYHEYRSNYYDYNRGRGRGRGRGRPSYYRRPEDDEGREREREYEETREQEEKVEETVKEEPEIENEEDLEDDFTCPICAGPLDPYEKNFSPCKCEFHVKHYFKNIFLIIFSSLCF